MTKNSFEKSSGNVFADIGFTPAEAAEACAPTAAPRDRAHLAGLRI